MMVVFEKGAPLRYIGHLDLMRTFQRAFMRAGIKVKHTEGYNPHAYVSVALPLSPVQMEYVCHKKAPKMLELMITGGKCLVTGKQYSLFKFGGLVNYGNFEDFYRDFIKEAGRITNAYLREQDIYSEVSEKNITVEPPAKFARAAEELFGKEEYKHAIMEFQRSSRFRSGGAH